MNTLNLTEKWTLSKGQDTYGYNICTIKDESGVKGQCNGGGYDMTGTSLANYLEKKGLNAKLLEIVTPENASYIVNEIDDTFTTNEKGGHTWDSSVIYGTYYRIEKNGGHRVTMDGATGLRNVMDIYQQAGIEIETVKSRSKRNFDRTGFVITY